MRNMDNTNALGANPVISFRQADIINGEATVVYNLNMDIFPGDLVYIVGKVGTGKTSIIRTITAENPLGGGSATVCGFDLATIKDKQIPYLRRKLGVVFQDFQLLMDRSVEENLEFVLKATGWKDNEAIDKRTEEVLDAVGLPTKAHKMPHQLSGGEQQRVAIARAILNDPEVIIADEPTGNLDGETAEGILSLLSAINKEKGTAIVMVTHNRSIIERYPGRVFETKDETCSQIWSGDCLFQPGKSRCFLGAGVRESIPAACIRNAFGTVYRQACLYGHTTLLRALPYPL